MSGVERHQIGDAPPVGWHALKVLLLLAGAPTAFLLALSVRYALTVSACVSTAGRLALEGTALLGVVVAAAVLRFGWKNLAERGERMSLEEATPVADTRADQGRFVAAAAVMTGLLFLLSSVALWLPSFFLSPCGP